MTRYYLYEHWDWQNDRARVHREGCRHVNHTRVDGGIQGDKDLWTDLGEHASADNAKDAALELLQVTGEDFAFCHHCLKDNDKEES